MKSLTKKIFVTIITGIIIVIFAAWGMGDLFSTGNKNIVAEVGNKKIYVKDYINQARLYVRKKNNNSLLDRDHSIILNSLISEKIYEKFAEDLNIKISDKSLAFFIKNDDNFKDKSGKFSRVEYEKYLLINNLNPKTVENFYKKELIKKVTIEIFINGISDTNYHKSRLKDDFLKQVGIKYYKFNISNKIEENEINNYFKKYKNDFSLGEMRTGHYSKLSHTNLGFDKESEEYYRVLDDIENDLINNLSYEEITKKYKLNINDINKINRIGLNKNRVKSESSKFAKSIFSLNENFKTEMFEINKVKFLINVKEIFSNVPINLNQQVKKEIIAKINYNKNIKLSDKIIENKKKEDFLLIAKNQNIKIKEIFLKNILDNHGIFGQKNMEIIFSSKINEIVKVVEDEKIYLIQISKITKNKEKIKNLDKALGNQIRKEFKALLLRDLDKYLITKYPVKLNKKVFDQIKKSI